MRRHLAGETEAAKRDMAQVLYTTTVLAVLCCHAIYTNYCRYHYYYVAYVTMKIILQLTHE